MNPSKQTKRSVALIPALLLALHLSIVCAHGQTTSAPSVLVKRTNSFVLVTAPALGDDGRFYATAKASLSSTNTGVICFDSSTLDLAWGPVIPYPCANRFAEGGVVVSSNGVVFGVGNGAFCGSSGRLEPLVAINAANGSTLWSRDPGNGYTTKQLTALDESRNSIYVGFDYFRSLDLNTHNENWHVPYSDRGIGRAERIVLDAAGNVYVEIEGELRSYTPPSESRRWSKSFHGTVFAVANGYVLLSDGGSLQAWNVGDGNLAWQVAGLANPVCDGAGNIYASSVAGSQVVSLTAAGAERWRITLPAVASAALDFVTSNGKLVARGDNKLFLLNTSDGGVSWSFSADNLLPVPAALARYGHLFMCDSAGTEYLLGTALTYAVSEWPVARDGNRRHTGKAFNTLQLPGPLVIYTQPTNQTVFPGTNVTFTAGAAGEPPLFYQWYFNGTNVLANQTNSSLVLSNLQLAQIGYYCAVVSNAMGATASSNALLIVYDVSDPDHDGLPNWWETLYGLNINNPLDATNHPPGDQLSYFEKYLYGLNPLTLDTDSDGLSDYAELFIYHTNPFTPDSDGDGMSDGDEVAAGRSATFSGNRFYYDRNDRLIGAEYENGLSIAYVYDGNGNIQRQRHGLLDGNTNGLPDFWEAQYDLTNNTSAYADPDGDGWSNYQEWRGGSNPLDRNSVPTNAPQTAPIASILPDPNSGNGLATNLIRLWDAEGNNSWPEMQFQMSGSTNWTNVTIVSIDGLAYSAVSALPTGSTHQVVWNAAAVFGTGVTNDLNLHARARDVTLTGDWSPPVAYHVEITVGNPMATNDTAITLEDTAIDINVLANDSVQSPAPKLLASIGQPAHGATSTNLNMTIRYVPATNWFGTDGFVYTLTDGAGGMSMATVYVSVVHVNQPPSAGAFSFGTAEDTPFTLQWNPALDAEGDVVTLQSAATNSVSGGTIVVNGDRLTYTPAPNFNGTDTFSYMVIDNGTTAGTNDFKTATGTVTVNVSAVNDPPVITMPGPQILPESNNLVFTNITVADVDAGSGAMLATLSVTNGALFLGSTNGVSFTSGTNGATSMAFTATLASLQASLSNLTYRPFTNFNGTDLVTIVVNDQGNTGSGGALSDTKTVLITVTSVNDVPVVTMTAPTNGAVFIAPATITLSASASDVDGQVVKVEFFSGTNMVGGALTNPPYQFIWSNVPAGIYSLFARATDNLGATNNSSLVVITNKQPGFVKLESPQNTNGYFSLLIQGEAGQVYNVQSSSNLNDWGIVATVTNNTGGVLYTEPVPTNTAQRYYRAKVVE